MKIKLFCIIIMSCLLCGCADAENTIETYKIQVSSKNYQGLIQPKEIIQINYDEEVHEIKVENGQDVAKNEVILKLKEEVIISKQKDLEREYDIDVVKSEIEDLQNELNDINKNIFDNSVVLSEMIDELKQQYEDIDRDIRSINSTMEINKINYEYEKKELENSGNFEELNKLTKIYEIERKMNLTDLDNSKNKKQKIKEEITNFSSSDSVKKRKTELENEIKRNKKIMDEYNYKKQEIANYSVKAKMPGKIVIDSNGVKLYSDESVFVYRANTKNFKKIMEISKYKLIFNGEIIGNLNYQYYTPSDEENFYDIRYSIELIDEKKELLKNANAIMATDYEIFIPKEYVGKDSQGKYYIKQNNEKKYVTIKKSDGEYKLISGLKIGDEIEKID